MSIESVKEAMESMKHEYLNIYALAGHKIPYPVATWWLFKEDKVNNLWNSSEDRLTQMVEDLEIHPNQVTFNTESTIWEARYELPKYQGEFQYGSDLNLEEPIVGIVDFIGGLSYGCIETAGMLWEGRTSTEEYYIKGKLQQGKIFPSMPNKLFKDMGDIVFNFIWLKQQPESTRQFLSKGIDDVKLTLHWWFRYLYSYLDSTQGNKKYPIPGNFLGYCVRIFPNLPSGKQLSTPFIVSGNFLDTLYYTRATMDTKTVATDNVWDIFTVTWRGTDKKIFTTYASDFAEYDVEDLVDTTKKAKVTILKDVATTRESQTWKDDQVFKEDLWQIVPVVFYREE